MKSIWAGAISFGLVNIPVKLFSAIEHKESVHFSLFHKKDKGKIKYKRFCEKENKEVNWNEIIRGLEKSKNNYIMLSKEEIDRLKPEKYENIEIIEFIDSEQLDSIFINSHYFLAPQKEKDRAFFLFKIILQSSGKTAIGRFILKDKEHVCAISSYKNGILLTTLNYQYEVRDIREIEELKSAPSLKKEEVSLANNLIDQLYNEHFSLEKYKDTFKEKLNQLLKRKDRKKPVEIMREVKKEPNLIKALRASLK